MSDGGHRIEVTARVPYPDGGQRILWRCVVDDCMEGHVEATPGAAAEAVVAKLVAGHEQAGGAVLDGQVAVVPW